MASDREFHKTGDHRSVAIPNLNTSVVFNMASGNTSSSDTGTNKYFDNLASSVPQFNMVADQVVEITAIDGVSLTEGISVAANAIYAEDKGEYRNITVRTTVDNTTISLRVR